MPRPPKELPFNETKGFLCEYRAEQIFYDDILKELRAVNGPYWVIQTKQDPNTGSKEIEVKSGEYEESPVARFIFSGSKKPFETVFSFTRGAFRLQEIKEIERIARKYICRPDSQFTIAPWHGF